MLCPSHSYKLFSFSFLFIFQSLRGQLPATFREETVHLQHLSFPTKTFTSLQRLQRKNSTDGESANQNLWKFRVFDSSTTIGHCHPWRHPPPCSDWLVFPALWKAFEYASLCGSVLLRCWFKLTQISESRDTQWGST